MTTWQHDSVPQNSDARGMKYEFAKAWMGAGLSFPGGRAMCHAIPRYTNAAIPGSFPGHRPADFQRP